MRSADSHLLMRKAEAAALEGKAAGWLVVWGEHSCRFWALAGWHLVTPVQVSAATVGELERRMWEIETTYPKWNPPLVESGQPPYSAFGSAGAARKPLADRSLSVSSRAGAA